MPTIDVARGTSARELQELIDTAPSESTLLLESGDYRFDQALRINRSDITLKGAGTDSTTLTFTDAALDDNDRFGIGVEGDMRGETLGTLATDLGEGERNVRLGDGHGLEHGDTVRIWQDNDSAFFDEIGDTSWRKQKHAELRTSMAKVEAVSGDTITLDRGAHFDFAGGKAKLERLVPVDDVSLEGFTVGYELGTPDASAFSNTQGDLTGYQAIRLDGATDAHLQDVAVENGPSTAFHFARSLELEADSLRAEGAFNKGSGGNGYGFELKESYDGSFNHLEDSGMRHGVLFSSWRSSVGNEIEVDFTDRDINFHGGRDHDNQVRVAQSVRNPEADELSPALWVNAGGESFGAITDADANEVRFDYVQGSRRSDVLQGSDDGVYLNGGLGHDGLFGGAGHDVLEGGPGDDWYDGDDLLSGGAGIDTVRYAGPIDAYRIDFDGASIAVHSDKGATDTLEEVELVSFGDGTVLHTASRGTFQAAALDAPEPDDILGSNAIPTGLVDAGTELLVSGSTTQRWDDGYVAEIFVENMTDTPLAAPELRLETDDTIDTLWNGELRRDGDAYLVRDDSAGELDPGEAWRFAYRAYGDEPTPDAVTGTDGQDVALLGMHDGSDLGLLG
ncbi:alginate biosynthesis protein [Billgrantia diversa]|uniref:cellulose binding domain-containing protein n=1 Tax=Halomonas sp. MCCC 1A13316 TaxID=2733487 RepID=UPI0018A47163|nr:cellulose binding domain-containing protein [Halomonas sp. MCCC 1A13316]QOR38239.1 alginate biosynthesis protein [Halomonas sp. MCCC 1A13316]